MVGSGSSQTGIIAERIPNAKFIAKSACTAAVVRGWIKRYRLARGIILPGKCFTREGAVAKPAKFAK